MKRFTKIVSVICLLTVGQSYGMDDNKTVINPADIAIDFTQLTEAQSASVGSSSTSASSSSSSTTAISAHVYEQTTQSTTLLSSNERLKTLFREELVSKPAVLKKLLTLTTKQQDTVMLAWRCSQGMHKERIRLEPFLSAFDKEGCSVENNEHKQNAKQCSRTCAIM